MSNGDLVTRAKGLVKELPTEGPYKVALFPSGTTTVVCGAFLKGELSARLSAYVNGVDTQPTFSQQGFHDGARVRLAVPARGNKRKLVTMAERNAEVNSATDEKRVAFGPQRLSRLRQIDEARMCQLRGQRNELRERFVVYVLIAGEFFFCEEV